MACFGFCGRRARADWKWLVQDCASHDDAQNEVFFAALERWRTLWGGEPRSGHDMQRDEVRTTY
jgi:hypothetical protein